MRRQLCSIVRLSLLAFAVLAIHATIDASNASAQGNWEYLEEYGGWLDWDSGLVWGDPVFIQNNYGIGSWNYTSTTFLNLFRADSGNAAWRLGTVAELQSIAANQGWSFLFSTSPDPYNGNGAPVWASNQQGAKKAYIVYHDGRAVLTQKSQYHRMLPVFRLFTP